jgi:hypothetical protein
MILNIFVVVRFDDGKAGAGIILNAEEYGTTLEKQAYYYLYDSTKELAYINAFRLSLESIKKAYNQYKVVLYCDDDCAIKALQSDIGGDYLLEISKLKRKMSEFRSLDISVEIPIDKMAVCAKLAYEALKERDYSMSAGGV